MGWPQWIVLLVSLQRLAELALARHNTRRLMAAGGVEHGRRHYPLFILLHAGWLISLFVLVPPQTSPQFGLLFLFLLLQAGRVWIVATLGRYWTTRIISIDAASLVRKGPYRWIRHPNYLVVALEIAVLPLAFGAWELAAFFTVLNLPLLAWRIGVEESAISKRRRGREG